MNRRALGRGRLIVAVGATLLLLGSLPPWWTVGGTVTQVQSGNAFEGVGILVFVSAVALLALIVLPYATREGESRLDRPWSYLLLTGIAVSAFGLRLLEINSFGGLGLPDRAAGLWISGSALAVVSWGVAEMLAQSPPEY